VSTTLTPITCNSSHQAVLTQFVVVDVTGNQVSGGASMPKCHICIKVVRLVHCVSKNDPTLKRYSLKLYGSILMILGRNIHPSWQTAKMDSAQKSTLEELICQL